MKHNLITFSLFLQLVSFGTSFAQDNPIETTSVIQTAPDMVQILIKGNLKEFETAIANGGDINASDESGKSLLVLAIEKNKPKHFEILLSHGADLNKRDLSGKTLLHYVVTSRFTNQIKTIVEKGADLNAYDADGNTALHVAVLKSNLAVQKLLVESKADVNLRNNPRKSPLYLAFEKSKTDSINYLLQNGADINLPDLTGRTTVFVSIDQKNLKLLTLSLDSNGNPNTEDTKSIRPVVFAIEKGFTQGLEVLLNRGADVNAKTPEGESLLFYALEKKNLTAINLLLKKGLNVDSKNLSGKTLFELALQKNDSNLLKLVLDAGANPNQILSTNKNPLEDTIESSKWALSDILIQKNADLLTPNPSGYLPIHLASRKSGLRIVEALLKKNVPVDALNLKTNETSLSLALENKQIAIAKFLLTKKADPNHKQKDGVSLIFSTIERKDAEAFKLLVSAGADLQSLNEEGENLITEVCKLDIDKKEQKFADETIKLLVTKGLNPNTKNKRGLSALHIALNRNRIDTMSQLITLGADPNLTDNNGLTVLHKAIQKFLTSRDTSQSESYKKLVLFLVERRANINQQDKLGKTILSELAIQFDPGKSDSILELARVFVLNGGDSKVKDKMGKSPLEYAEEKRIPELIEIYRGL